MRGTLHWRLKFNIGQKAGSAFFRIGDRFSMIFLISAEDNRRIQPSRRENPSSEKGAGTRTPITVRLNLEITEK